MTTHRRMMPRDGAGKMSLIGGTGPLLFAVGLPTLGFMEQYKVDRTFRIQSPNDIDPTRTKPDVPWAWKVTDEVGSSNPIVARVFIQCAEALKNKPLKRGDSERIKVAFHACKQELRICETVFVRMAKEHDTIVQSISDSGGVRVENRVVNDLPQIARLEDDATLFITSAKRVLQHIAEALNEFYAINISNARFDKGKLQLKTLTPEPKKQLELLEFFRPTIERVLDLRNFQEHTPKQTIIQNFHLTANSVEPPTWRVQAEPDVRMLPEMEEIIGALIELAEYSFFHALVDNLDHPPGPFKYVVEKIPDSQREETCPVRFRCELRQVVGVRR